MIILIIIILIIGSVVCLITVGGDFHKELRELEVLEQKLQNSYGTTDPNIIYRSVSSAISKDSLVFERVNIVFRLGSKNIIPVLSEISELTISKKESDIKNRFANLVISVLLIIGLGGTFWAFRDILTNSELNQVISSDGGIDSTKYQQSINKIYGGFQYAFRASLLGIFGTVILVFVKFLYVSPIRSDFFNRLDLVTQVELIPLFAKPRQSEAILLAVVTKLDAVVADIQLISHNLHKSTTQANNMGPVFAEFASTFKDAIQIFSDITSDKSPLFHTMNKLFDEVRKSEGRYEKLIDEVKESIKVNQDQNARLAETQKAFVELHILLEKLNITYRDAILNQGEDFKNTIRQIDTAIQGLNSSAGKIEGPAKEISKKLDELERLDKLDEIEALIQQLPKNSYSKELVNIQALLKRLDKFDNIEVAIQQLPKNSYSDELGEIQRLLKELHKLDKLDSIEMAVQQLPKNSYSDELGEIHGILKGLDKLDKIETTVQQLSKNSYSDELGEIHGILKGLDKLDRIEMAVQQLPKNSYSDELGEIHELLKGLRKLDKIVEIQSLMEQLHAAIQQLPQNQYNKQFDQIIKTIREIYDASNFERQGNVDPKQKHFNLPFFGSKK